MRPACAGPWLALVALCLAGCTRDLLVTPPVPEPSVATVCAALAGSLPATVAGRPRRGTTPSSDLTAAWGDPPIVLRCGVARPAGLLPTSQVTTVNGVDWYPEPHTDGYVFTTTGRSAYVQVTVPSEYGSSAGGLPELAAAVKSANPQNADGSP